MIKNLSLKNFRNFSQADFYFSSWLNFIIWENWLWKTNILEAISILSNNPLQEINFESLIKSWEKNMFISWIFENEIAISFDLEEKKKKIFVNKNSTTKKNLTKNSSKTIIFSPNSMNLFYLTPSYRRKFLDNILHNCFESYKEHYKNFEKILKQRNKFLKWVLEWKEDIKNIWFWNETYIKQTIQIYKYRKNLLDFYKKNLTSLEKYFLNKKIKLDLVYNSKINLFGENLNNNNFEEKLTNFITKYFEKNLNLEKILARTTIWPHLDDFDILINNYKIVDFASRWEIKSSILWLKFIEIDYLIKNYKKKPIILIDDFLSEIDDKHKKLLLANLKDFQTIITTIKELKIDVFENVNKIFVK